MSRIYCGNALYELEGTRNLLKSKYPDDLIDAARRMLKAYLYLNGVVPGDNLASLAGAVLNDERFSDFVKALGMLFLSSSFGERGPLLDKAKEILVKYHVEIWREYEVKCK